MDHFDVEAALDTMIILVDTREQDTPQLRGRLKAMRAPYKREKLDFGDYSARCVLPSGEIFDLSGRVAVERKMSFDELCACYCRGRTRFTKEFERARDTKAKIYLLVENASWEKAYRGDYRSRMSPESFIASLTAWLARYQCQLIFCSPSTSGRLIRDLLFREMKERLEKYEPEGKGDESDGSKTERRNFDGGCAG